MAVKILKKKLETKKVEEPSVKSVEPKRSITVVDNNSSGIIKAIDDLGKRIDAKDSTPNIKLNLSPLVEKLDKRYDNSILLNKLVKEVKANTEAINNRPKSFKFDVIKDGLGHITTVYVKPDNED